MCSPPLLSAIRSVPQRNLPRRVSGIGAKGSAEPPSSVRQLATRISQPVQVPNVRFVDLVGPRAPIRDEAGVAMCWRQAWICRP
jgi:hypothetical protein